MSKSVIMSPRKPKRTRKYSILDNIRLAAEATALKLRQQAEEVGLTTQDIRSLGVLADTQRTLKSIEREQRNQDLLAQIPDAELLGALKSLLSDQPDLLRALLPASLTVEQGFFAIQGNSKATEALPEPQPYKNQELTDPKLRGEYPPPYSDPLQSPTIDAPNEDIESEG